MKKHTNLDNEIEHHKPELPDWIFPTLVVVGVVFISWLILIIVSMIEIVNIAHAQEVTVSVSIPCNNLNWEYSKRCIAPVAEFWQTTDGFAGYLESGVHFTQTNYGSLMLFKMEDVCWLTNGYTTVYCDL